MRVTLSTITFNTKKCEHNKQGTHRGKDTAKTNQCFQKESLNDPTTLVIRSAVVEFEKIPQLISSKCSNCMFGDGIIDIISNPEGRKGEGKEIITTTTTIFLAQNASLMTN